MKLMLKMQKRKEKYKKNTFDNPCSKYINVDNRYSIVDVRYGGQKPTQNNLELILERRELFEPQLSPEILQDNISDFNYRKTNFPCDKIKDGSIIKLFNKTPTPQHLSDVVCPHFYELKWANGCNFNCAWCYLNGTYRFLKRGKKPHLKNIETTLEHLDYFFKTVRNKTYLLNSGELSDSLLFENDGAPISRKIIPKFMEQNRHKLLILTKSNNVDNLLKINAQDHVITSFSLNSFKVSDKWEKAPRVIDRIKAAKKLFDAGYKVRVRIDPMVPIENWRNEYLSLIDIIFDNLKPERITLGSLRGLQSTINNSKDTSWTKYLTETSNWGKKVDMGYRLAMYSALINHLKMGYDYNKVALCKETIEIWNKLKMDYNNIKCNCIL